MPAVKVVHTGKGSLKPPAAQEASAAYLAIYQPLAKERCFIDTNLLIYADSGDEAIKQRIALTLLKQLRLNQTGVLSTQVLNEYCNVALWEQYEVVQVTPVIIHMGLDLHQTRSIGFFDALIVAAAKISGCTVLYSEDMNAGEIVNGVRIVNPFAI